MALIVVADDEYLLAGLLADVLESEGHEVVIAAHGLEALDHMRARRPALVITDFMMPVMTGLELAQATKADHDLRTVPILLVSGAQGSIARQHEGLFFEVFDKPYSNAAILDAVERILRE